MKEIVIDCCGIALAQQGDSRVKFTHRFVSRDVEFVVVRTHCPLSVAMQVISFNQVIPNGFKDSYLVETETVDEQGHVEE